MIVSRFGMSHQIALNAVMTKSTIFSKLASSLNVVSANYFTTIYHYLIHLLIIIRAYNQILELMRNRKDKSHENETSLDYHRRSLTSIPITNLIAGKIENIDLSQNFLRSVNELSNIRFSRLRSLNLTNNMIGDISGLDSGYFPVLEKLFLYGNQIQDLKPLSTIHAPELTQLKLGFRNSGNKIKDKNIQLLISQLKCPQLSELTLDFNQICRIDFLKGCQLKKLTLLYVSGNKIQSIDPYCLNELQNIKILSFKNNFISNLAFMRKISLPFLEYLNISDNFISSSQHIQRAEIKLITKLSLSHNLINDFAMILKCDWSQASQIQISELCSASQKTVLKQIRKKLMIQ